MSGAVDDMALAALARLPLCACGAVAMAWHPGQDSTVRPLPGVVVDPAYLEQPVRGWCATCWTPRFARWDEEAASHRCKARRR